MNQRLFIEAVVVGVLIVVFGKILFGLFFDSEKDWNKNYSMEMALFFTGFITHLFCEYVGLNNWYCKHGNACKK